MKTVKTADGTICTYNDSGQKIMVERKKTHHWVEILDKKSPAYFPMYDVRVVILPKIEHWENGVLVKEIYTDRDKRVIKAIEAAEPKVRDSWKWVSRKGKVFYLWATGWDSQCDCCGDPTGDLYGVTIKNGVALK